MNKLKDKIPAIMMVTGALIVCIALGWTPIQDAIADKGDTPAASCGKVQYLAYEKGTRSGDFGPAVQADDVDQAKKQFKRDLCTDPLLFATDKAFAESGLKLDDAKAAAKAKYYASHPAAWKSDLDDFMSASSNFRLVDDKHRYYSIGMERGKDSSVMPKLVRGSEPVNIGKALRLDHDGVTREYRLECHFQPVARRPFTHVPAKPSKPTPGRKTPPKHRAPSKCVPPKYSGKPGYTTGCNAHKKKQSYDCQQNGGPNCAPNPAHQDPQTNRGNQGKVQQQPSTVPSQAPEQNPTRPVDTKNPSKPPEGGNNGGSKSNPIVSGSPVNGHGGTPTNPVAPPP